MVTNYHHLLDPESLSHKEVIPQAFRKKDIRTIQLFDRENLYSKNSLLFNILSFYPSNSTDDVFTLPLVPSLQLGSNYKNLLKKGFRASNVSKSVLSVQRRSRLLKNRLYKKMRYLPIHFFTKQRLFRMRYKRLFSILSKIHIKDNSASKVRFLLKQRVLHKHLSRIANKKVV